MEDERAIQPENSPGDRIKPWQFKKGQSGNPSGKPKGAVSLKTWAKNYIQNLTDEERLDFLEGIDKKTVWEMAEGKADTKTELGGSVEAKIVIMPPEVIDRIHGVASETEGGNQLDEEV